MLDTQSGSSGFCSTPAKQTHSSRYFVAATKMGLIPSKCNDGQTLEAFCPIASISTGPGVRITGCLSAPYTAPHIYPNPD